LARLAVELGGDVEGDPDLPVSSVTGVEDAAHESLVRVDSEKYLEAALSGPGAALLLGRQVSGGGKPAIRVSNPRLAFARCLELFNPAPAEPPPGIHQSAVLGEDVRLGERVAIMACAAVGDSVTLGDGVVLYPQVTV